MEKTVEEKLINALNLYGQAKDAMIEAIKTAVIKSPKHEVVYEVVVNEQFDIRENRTVLADEEEEDFIIVDENDDTVCKLEDTDSAELFNICMANS